MKKETQKIRRPFLVEAIANGCKFEQNEPNGEGHIMTNVWLQAFSPDYLPIKKNGQRVGTKIKNDHRIAIFNNNVMMESNYQVFKDMETLEKSIAIVGVEIQALERLR